MGKYDARVFDDMPKDYVPSVFFSLSKPMTMTWKGDGKKKILIWHKRGRLDRKPPKLVTQEKIIFEKAPQKGDTIIAFYEVGESGILLPSGVIQSAGEVTMDWDAVKLVLKQSHCTGCDGDGCNHASLVDEALEKIKSLYSQPAEPIMTGTKNPQFIIPIDMRGGDEVTLLFGRPAVIKRDGVVIWRDPDIPDYVVDALTDYEGP